MADRVLDSSLNGEPFQEQSDGIFKTLKKHLGIRTRTSENGDVKDYHQRRHDIKVERSEKTGEERGETNDTHNLCQHVTDFGRDCCQHVTDFGRDCCHVDLAASSVKLTTAKHTSHSELSSKVQTQNVENRYPFNHKRRGYMVLVVNDQILNDDDHRKGASKDLRKMEEIGQKFGFELLNPEMKLNLSKPDLQRILERAQKSDHTDSDCFVFMISTHGEQDSSRRMGAEEDYGLLCADEQIIHISEIIKMFDDHNCPTLKDKPKLFFIQACRGPRTDDGNSIHVFKRPYTEQNGNCYDSTPTTIDAKGRHVTASQHEETPYLGCHNDMLIMFAAPPGMIAWRSEYKGSWMIHSLHEVFMNYDFAKPKNLLNVLTKVCRLMSQCVTRVQDPELNGKTVVPVIEHKLIKDILF